MELHHNNQLFCTVLDQLEGSPLPLYLAQRPESVQAVRTMFLGVTKEEPVDGAGQFALVDNGQVLPIKIVDWNRLGSRIWVKCYLMDSPLPVRSTLASAQARL